MFYFFYLTDRDLYEKIVGSLYASESSFYEIIQLGYIPVITRQEQSVFLYKGKLYSCKFIRNEDVTEDEREQFRAVRILNAHYKITPLM